MNTMTMTVSLSDQHGDKNEKLTQRIECGLKKEKETLGRDSKVLYSNPGSTANTSLPPHITDHPYNTFSTDAIHRIQTTLTL